LSTPPKSVTLEYSVYCAECVGINRRGIEDEPGTDHRRSAPNEAEFRDRFVYKTGIQVDPFDRRTEYVDVYFWSGNAFNPGTEEAFANLGYTPRNGAFSPQSQYYTMSYLSESRFYPLGSSNDILLSDNGDSPDVALNDNGIWLVPTSKQYPSGESRNDYEGHRWHSGQFRMTMPEQKEYWKAVMRSCSYPLENALP